MVEVLVGFVPVADFAEEGVGRKDSWSYWIDWRGHLDCCLVAAVEVVGKNDGFVVEALGYFQGRVRCQKVLSRNT